MHRTFSLWTHVFSLDADCWYRGVFAKYFYSLGLNQHMICFLLQCNAPCLEGSNFLQFFVLVFLLIFCVVKSVNGLKKTQKVEFSLLSWFCVFFHVLCMVFLDTWHQRCRVAPPYAKEGFFVEALFLWSCLCSELRVQPEGAQTGPGQSGFAVSSLLPRAQCQPSSTGCSQVRAQEEIKLFWTQLSAELSPGISSFSCREPQRAMPACPGWLEQLERCGTGGEGARGTLGRVSCRNGRKSLLSLPGANPAFPSPPVPAGSREGPWLPWGWVTHSLQEEMRVKMGDQRRNPWGCGAGRELTDPPVPSPAARGSRHCSALCAWGDFPNPTARCCQSSQTPCLIPEGWKGPAVLCQAGQVLSLLQGALGASRGWGVPLGSCGGGCQSPGVEINKIRNALAAGLGSAYRGSTETL